jgi:catechol 2,3-dioxygenase-like lactoylglutathione lyase family enzyme
MSIVGVDRVTYGVEDIASCKRFFADWGLKLVRETPDALDFECINGAEIQVRRKEDPSLPDAIEPGPTVREVVWGVDSETDLDRLRTSLKGSPGFSDAGGTVACTDPNGLALRFRVTRKHKVDVQGTPSNVYGAPPQRVDKASPIYERGEPVDIGHVVFFTPVLDEVEAFYTGKLGFVPSDRYVGRSLFMRCDAYGGHHDILFVKLPTGKRGLNHVAFSVRDIHEVFGGGLHISRCGWDTDIGPGRHPISSAYFWYFKCPAGGNIEYYADEDQLTPAWKPREVETKPENFAEWAVMGGIDGNSRRQKSGPASEANAVAGQAAGRR